MTVEAQDEIVRAKPPCGPVDGARVNGVAVFKGVPYAEPPIGDRRWRRPGPPKDWTEPRPAMMVGPFCPQYDIDRFGLFKDIPMSEDCLYLNIWTPAADAKARPVLFYIHGGGFAMGSGATPIYAGEVLAAQHDVVVVTINYRLSIFGLPPFAVHGSSEPTNLGLLDQIEALRWIKRNIAAFGGDPGNVTLFGLSAGGWSIISLCGMAEAKGLFHKVVAQSSSALTTLTDQARALATTAILEKLHLPDVDPERLMAASTEDILDAGEAAHRAWENELADLGDRYRPSMPQIDAVLPARPMDLATSPDTFRGPLLIGGTREEVGFNPFRSGVTFLEPYFRKAGCLKALEVIVGAPAAAAIWDGYEALTNRSEAQIGGMIRTALDYTMPSIRFAEARAATAPTWMYQVTYAPAKVAAATHACDIVLWSGVLGPSGLVDFFYGENGIGDLERRLSQTMREDLVALARTGELPWDRYDRARRATRIYDIHPRIAFDPAAPERRIWDGAQL
jgi:para-nitrobenzyl esterase